MNVIGYSGLHNSMPFKRRYLPGLTDREYGISHGRHSAAALITPAGIVAAAAEERFTLRKGTGEFPVRAVRYCLDRADLGPAAIDRVAHAFSYEPYLDAFSSADPYEAAQYNEVFSPDAQRQILRDQLPEFGWDAKLFPVPHHMAHAASAYWLSGFPEALILVADGMGEVHATTVAVGRAGRIERPYLREITADHSLGLFYGILTLFLGFSMDQDEYKVMGLAAYGNPRTHFARVMDLVRLGPNGTFTVPLLREDRTRREKETHARAVGLMEQGFGMLARRPGEPLTADHADAAAAGQSVLQECLLHSLRYFRSSTGLKELCLAGGVALNCAANGVIKRSGLFRSVFVQPAAGDDGAALGAALYALHGESGRQESPKRMAPPYWGPGYEQEDIRSALRRKPHLTAEVFSCPIDLVRATADLLASDRIVGWFQGRMEFGPRALGNRSILADPRRVETRERVNHRIKGRETFRPLAPAVTTEAAAQFFDLEPGDERAHDAMLFATRVRPEWRSVLAAVTHVDGTARVQTVAREDNPLFWDLLAAFGTVAGVPVLLNTSFNGPGEPIVCSPDDALATFERVGLDAVILGDYLVRKSVGHLL